MPKKPQGHARWDHKGPWVRVVAPLKVADLLRRQRASFRCNPGQLVDADRWSAADAFHHVKHLVGLEKISWMASSPMHRWKCLLSADAAAAWAAAAAAAAADMHHGLSLHPLLQASATVVGNVATQTLPVAHATPMVHHEVPRRCMAAVVADLLACPALLHPVLAAVRGRGHRRWHCNVGATLSPCYRQHRQPLMLRKATENHRHRLRVPSHRRCTATVVMAQCRGCHHRSAARLALVALWASILPHLLL